MHGARRTDGRADRRRLDDCLKGMFRGFTEAVADVREESGMKEAPGRLGASSGNTAGKAGGRALCSRDDDYDQWSDRTDVLP